MNEHWMPLCSTYISLCLCLFRSEEHITKILPSLHTSSSNLAHRFLSARLAMFSGVTEICFRISILRSSMVRGLVVYTLTLRYPQSKQSQTERSREYADHGSSPRSEITCSGNISQMTSMDILALWAVAPSCWNHTVESSIPQLSSGVRKFHNVSK
jgi:hypothetical protein